ncbi:alpha/beta fold hydrolase [bacterium]|nr:alpha/beta fold hydrolase [bacterium]
MSWYAQGLWLLGAAIAAPMAYLAHMRRRLGGDPCPAELSYLTTPDGARLALYHYPAADPIPGREPVLLISGFGVNRAALDFDDRFSWARRLAAEGFDTWLLEVRGSGLSRRAGIYDGAFDDYLVDARTAISHVRDRTGALKLHWVGYSLGGMLLYAALGSEEADLIRSGVAIESPVSLYGYPLDKTSLAALDVMERFPWLHAVPYRLPSRLAMDLLPLWYEQPLFKAWMNTENIDRKLLKAIVYRTLDDVPTPLVLQFRDWIREDGLRSRNGATDYLAGLATTEVPLLVMTGDSEFARRARLVMERSRPANVRWIECLRANGFSADYGHTDLLFGPRAPEEIFPHVLDWLRVHDPAGNLAMT